MDVFAIPVLGQESTIEKVFEKNKRTFAVSKFGFGEDAHSGYDYLVYKKKLQVQKIRIVWYSSQALRVTDLYFENGKPVLFLELTARQNQYNALKKGLTVPLKVEEKLVFANSKLKTWSEKGQTIPATDSRWAEKEKEVLTRFNGELETYQAHVRGEI